MNKRPGYSPEVRERAIRLVLTSEEVDTGAKSEVTSDPSKRMKAHERENRELKRANEILKKAAAFFTQAEFDRKPR